MSLGCFNHHPVPEYTINKILKKKLQNISCPLQDNGKNSGSSSGYNSGGRRQGGKDDGGGIYNIIININVIYNSHATQLYSDLQGRKERREKEMQEKISTNSRREQPGRRREEANH